MDLLDAFDIATDIARLYTAIAHYRPELVPSLVRAQRPEELGVFISTHFDVRMGSVHHDITEVVNRLTTGGLKK